MLGILDHPLDDQAVEGCSNHGVVQEDLGAHDLGGGGVEVRFREVVRLLADHLLAVGRLGPVPHQFRLGQVDAGDPELGLDFRRVDARQNLAGSDEVTLLHVQFDDRAVRPGHDVDLVLGLERAVRLQVVRDVAANDARYPDRNHGCGSAETRHATRKAPGGTAATASGPAAARSALPGAGVLATGFGVRLPAADAGDT